MSGLISIPKRLTHDFILDNENLIFIYSTASVHNYPLGQASICASHNNCYGIPVRKSLCKSSGYWSDNIYDTIVDDIDDAIKLIPRDDRHIIVIPKIGYGASRLFEFGPKVLAYINRELDKIKYKNVEFI